MIYHGSTGQRRIFVCVRLSIFPLSVAEKAIQKVRSRSPPKERVKNKTKKKIGLTKCSERIIQMLSKLQKLSSFVLCLFSIDESVSVCTECVFLPAYFVSLCNIPLYFSSSFSHFRSPSSSYSILTLARGRSTLRLKEVTQLVWVVIHSREREGEIDGWL